MKYFLIICIFLLTASAYAQTTIRIGVRTGVHISIARGDHPDFQDYYPPDTIYAGGNGHYTYASRTTPSVGVALTYAWNETSALQFEVLYTKRSVIYENWWGFVLSDPWLLPGSEPPLYGSGRATLDISYLEFPVVLTAGIPTRSVVQPYLALGVAPAIRIGSSLSSKGSRQSAWVEEVVYKDALRVSMNDIVVGIVSGAGVRVDLSGVYAGLEARYLHSLNAAAYIRESFFRTDAVRLDAVSMKAFAEIAL